MAHMGHFISTITGDGYLTVIDDVAKTLQAHRGWTTGVDAGVAPGTYNLQVLKSAFPA